MILTDSFTAGQAARIAAIRASAVLVRDFSDPSERAAHRSDYVLAEVAASVPATAHAAVVTRLAELGWLSR